MAWAYVQSNQSHGTTGTAPTVATLSNTTAGNLLVLCVNTAATTGSWSVTDTQSNTWTQRGVNTIQGNTNSNIWSAFAASSAALTVTYNQSAGGSYTLIVLEYSGINAFVAAAGGSSAGSTSPATASCTISTSGSLLVGAWGDRNNSTITSTPGSGFTARQDQNIGNPNNAGHAADGPFNTSTAAAFTASLSTAWSASAASFDIPAAASDWEAEFATGFRSSTVIVPAGPYFQARSFPTDLLTGGVPPPSEWPVSPFWVTRKAEEVFSKRAFVALPFLLTGGVVLANDWTPSSFRQRLINADVPPLRQPQSAWLWDMLNVRPIPPSGPGRGKEQPFVRRVPQQDTRRMAHALDILHGVVNALAGTGQLIKTGLESWDIHTSAHTDTRAPGAMDDGQSGYPVGCHWVNTSTLELYVCVYNADYSAVWRGPL